MNNAYVEANRHIKTKALVGYSVYQDRGIIKDCIGTFMLKDYSTEVALHLARKLRDDVNNEVE